MKAQMDTFTFSPIGIISSCYKEKFGIPRQPGLVSQAKAELHLNKDYHQETIRGLEGFSHIWLQFVFHATSQQGWKTMVRPPRLGGNTKVGVFASRSPFRPNPLGLSVVELRDIEIKHSRVTLHLGGCDLLDGTPVLDIKPYLPYVDEVSDALGGFANASPKKLLVVNFTDKALQQCEQAKQRLDQEVRLFIEQILQLDPRPSYQRGESGDRIYSMKLCDFDLKWEYCENSVIRVLELALIGDE